MADLGLSTAHCRPMPPHTLQIVGTQCSSLTTPPREGRPLGGPGMSRLGRGRATRCGRQPAARAGARRVAVEAQHSRDLVALAAPRRPRRTLPVRRRQRGGGEPGGQHRVRAADVGGVRTNEGCQCLRHPARVERGLHGRGEPGPLIRSQPPEAPESGEEFADRAAAEPVMVDRRRLARSSGGGGGFRVRFFGRFGCNRCTPWLRQLHPVGALIAPRSWLGVQLPHPVA